MAIAKQLVVINDFSSGEVDIDVKRGGTSVTASGGRQMSNWRVLNSNKKTNRSGRSALFLETGRVDEVLMSPDNKFFLAFGAGYLRVYNAAGTRVFSSTLKGDGVTPIPWTLATVQNIVWEVGAGTVLQVFICYADGAPNNVPQILTWDGVSQTSTWTLSNFAETITAGGQKRTAFYRISPQNISLQPSASSGNITLTATSALFVAGQVGTRLRWAYRQVLITAVGSSTSASATVIETLPEAQQLTLTGSTGAFSVGDTVIGSLTGATGIVTTAPNQQTIELPFGADNNSLTGNLPNIGEVITGVTSGATGILLSSTLTEILGIHGNLVVSLETATLFQGDENLTWSGGSLTCGNSNANGATLIVQLLPDSTGYTPAFNTSDTIAGPSASAGISTVTTESPQPIGVWDDEVMNTFRGYPLSVFYDQSRLGFCNFPSLPSSIAWSAIGLSGDFYPDASSADNAIFELAPGKSQVLYVQPGMESSEFVFCDNAVYYIPISASLPLEPGSVAFNLLSTEGCYGVQPRPAEQTILYIKAGGLQVGAVQAPGAYYRPYVIDVVAEFHSHLFTPSAPITLAVPSASAQFQELYAYILLENGTVLCGRYSIRGGLLDVGAEGKPKIGWLPWTGAGTPTWVSALGSDLIFTSSYAPNGVPAVSIVEKLDNTQYLDGALSVNNLPAPFTPPSGKGPLYNFPGPNSTVFLIDLVTRFMGVYNVDANGWIIPQNQGGENLDSAQLVAGQPWTSVFEPFIPDAGTGQDAKQRTRRRKIVRAAVSVENSSGFVYAASRVPAYFVGDNAEVAAPLREYTYRFRYPGRFFDPRVVLEKDTPGPLTVIEHAIEVTV